MVATACDMKREKAMTKKDGGALFFVEDRQTEDDPFATGQCEIDGKEYWMEAWKYVENDVIYMDLRIKLKKNSPHRNGDGDGRIEKLRTKSSDKAPDWKGNLQMADGGPKFEVAGWRRQSSKTGQWFLSVAINPPYEGRGSRGSSTTGSNRPSQEQGGLGF